MPYHRITMRYGKCLELLKDISHFIIYATIHYSLYDYLFSESLGCARQQVHSLMREPGLWWRPPA